MKNALRNWKTTLLGVLTLAGTAAHAYQNPASLADPTVLAGITAGIGLIVAKDGDKSGTVTVPK